MGFDVPLIREARPEDAPLLAAAERAIASVPGKLASMPDEIVDDGLRKKIVELDDRCGGIYLVAEHAGTVVGHGFLEPLSLAATSHVVRLMIGVHEGHQRQGVGESPMLTLRGSECGDATTSPAAEQFYAMLDRQNR